MASLDVGGTSTRASSPLLSCPEFTIPSTEQSNVTPNAFSTLQPRPAPPSSTTSQPPKKKRRIKAENTWNEFRDPEGDEPMMTGKEGYTTASDAQSGQIRFLLMHATILRKSIKSSL